MAATTEEKLFREVAAHPDDDAPRQVMADWYEEQANPRGQLIRRQCELATLDWDDPRYGQLESTFSF